MFKCVSSHGHAALFICTCLNPSVYGSADHHRPGWGPGSTKRCPPFPLTTASGPWLPPLSPRGPAPHPAHETCSPSSPPPQGSCSHPAHRASSPSFSHGEAPRSLPADLGVYILQPFPVETPVTLVFGKEMSLSYNVFPGPHPPTPAGCKAGWATSSYQGGPVWGRQPQPAVPTPTPPHPC